VIPIRDRNPSGTFPYVTIGIIIINVFIFLYELSLGSDLAIFVHQYGVVPVKATHYFQTPDLSLKDTFFPFLSSTFLHAGFIHLIGNMWFLWIFGDNIEDRLGHIKYLCFYILCGAIASSVHVFFNSQSQIPCIGASGAIAAVLGAYMVTFPRAKGYHDCTNILFHTNHRTPGSDRPWFLDFDSILWRHSIFNSSCIRWWCSVVGTHRRFCVRNNTIYHNTHTLCEKVC